MNPLKIIYWTRVLLGIVAALICTLFNELVGGISIFNGISIALLVYIISYYVYKALFLTKVEKSTKIFTTGVGAYFLTWLVLFSFFFTMLGPTLAITNPTPSAVFSAGNIVTITAKLTSPFGTSFSGADVIARSPTDTIIQLTEASPGTYSATYNITSSDRTGAWNMRVEALINGRYWVTSVIVQIQTSSEQFHHPSFVQKH